MYSALAAVRSVDYHVVALAPILPVSACLGGADAPSAARLLHFCGSILKLAVKTADHPAEDLARDSAVDVEAGHVEGVQIAECRVLHC
jgi:hypothetical protein